MAGHDVFLIVVTSMNVLISGLNIYNIVQSRRSIRRMKRQPKLHPTGVPVGLLPGDPIHAGNVRAMIDYVDEANT